MFEHQGLAVKLDGDYPRQQKNPDQIGFGGGRLAKKA